MDNNRVCCLYRVSTDKQVDYDSNHEADIPMQRKACHRFAEKMGWEIVHEDQEDGVSGHKVRAENRDKIQTIKELARKGKFDILLVFMFDRIRRIEAARFPDPREAVDRAHRRLRRRYTASEKHLPERHGHRPGLRLGGPGLARPRQILRDDRYVSSDQLHKRRVQQIRFQRLICKTGRGAVRFYI